MSYPIYSIIAVSFHAKTRIPYFSKGYSLAYLIVAIGPFMIIPNVGLNEWGHTFWFMEELFVAPLHWGFVFFGWMALGVFGVVLQLLLNIQRLVGKEGVGRFNLASDTGGRDNRPLPRPPARIMLNSAKNQMLPDTPAPDFFRSGLFYPFTMTGAGRRVCVSSRVFTLAARLR